MATQKLHQIYHITSMPLTCERVVGGGDIYQTSNGMNTSLYRDGGSVYRTVERPVSQDVGGDVYIDTVLQ
jgi:hypothetical protein